MDKLTFEELPKAVLRLSDKLDHIEQLLLEQQPAAIPPSSYKLLSIDEAASLLSLAKATIYGLVCRKAIPVCKKGKRLYFSEQELLAWIESGRKDSRGEIAELADELLAKQKRR